MTQIHGSPTALPPGAAAHPEAKTAGTADLPRPPEVTTPHSDWTPGRIAALAIGIFFGLVSLIPLGAGGTALWADATQRDDGYITSDVQAFSTSGSALVTEPADLGVPGIGWLYAPSVLGEIRIRVTPASAGSTLFVGSAPRTRSIATWPACVTPSSQISGARACDSSAATRSPRHLRRRTSGSPRTRVRDPGP